MQRKEQGVWVVGAGGHAKVIISALQALGQHILGLLDDDCSMHGKQILGQEVLGSLELIRNTDCFAICGIGNNIIRKRIANEFCHVKWISVIHPAAFVHDSVKVEEGSVIFAGSIIQPDTVIKKHAIINTGATIDHDCLINDFVHIGPGVHLAGTVSVGEGSFLGIGSAVIPNLSIGSWTTFGAGSVVIKSMGDNLKAKGVPAKSYETEKFNLVLT